MAGVVLVSYVPKQLKQTDQFVQYANRSHIGQGDLVVLL